MLAGVHSEQWEGAAPQVQVEWGPELPNQCHLLFQIYWDDDGQKTYFSLRRWSAISNWKSLTMPAWLTVLHFYWWGKLDFFYPCGVKIVPLLFQIRDLPAWYRSPRTTWSDCLLFLMGFLNIRWVLATPLLPFVSFARGAGQWQITCYRRRNSSISVRIKCKKTSKKL